MSQAYYARLFAALYLSADWYGYFERSGRAHARARAVVLFDRVITGKFDARKAVL